MPKKIRSKSNPADRSVGDRVEDCGGSGLRVPVLASGEEVDRPIDAERHRVPELLLGFGWPEREHDRLAPVLLDEPHRFLDAALLVRADREPEVLGRDRLLVRSEDDLASRHRDPLDAHEDVHERTRAFSGSKSGVGPATATVTG